MRSNKIKRETYDEYLEFINNYNTENDKWIYNIIDKLTEQEDILYRDDECIIIPTNTFDGNDINKLHILCIPTDKSLRCLRDLTNKNITLLKDIKIKTINIIHLKYNLDESNLKIYIHYEPSTYHLHIHFVNINFVDANSSVEYSHELNSVIFNLELDSDYYKKILLNRIFI